MKEPLPTLMVPGLLCSARLYAQQIPALWPFGPVVVADHRRDDSVAAIADHILAAAPPRFALAGLSMGGYLAFVIAQKAPQRVARLALLDTGAQPESPEQTERRLPEIALARQGRLGEVVEQLFPLLVHPNRRNDAALQEVVARMAEETGPEAFIRQQTALMARPDARPLLAAIRCPTLVLVGEGDALTPPFLSEEIAAGIAGARLVIVPDCGHLSTLERPEAVNAALRDWMAD